MDLPTPTGDALAQPTRAQLFAALNELRRPAGTEELAERLGLHPNGIRLHLEQMLGAGLVVRDRARHGRGRPRDMWAISPEARPGGQAPTGYADLGRWLARVVTKRKTSLRGVEAAGREIGRDLASADGGASPEESVYAAFVSLGFQPRREAGPDGSLTYELCNCPYRDVVGENQPLVCTLHRGITRGLIDATGTRTRLERFVPQDPYDAGCIVALRGELADDAVRRIESGDR
jgi:predicted ArsR family transcriptional regulator